MHMLLFYELIYFNDNPLFNTALMQIFYVKILTNGNASDVF